MRYYVHNDLYSNRNFMIEGIPLRATLFGVASEELKKYKEVARLAIDTYYNNIEYYP